MYLQDVEVLKEIPGYKALLKAVIKSQIQMLVEQLSDQTGEESIILTASTVDGSLSHLGSTSGKDFFIGREEIKSQFLSHCLHKASQNGNTDILHATKKARYSESGHSIQDHMGYVQQQYNTSYSGENQTSNALQDWESSSLGQLETSTDRGGKMVVRKKRFKHVPITKTVPNASHGKVHEAMNQSRSTGIKSEPIFENVDNTETSTVHSETRSELDETGLNTSVSGIDQTSGKHTIKVEMEDDDDTDMTIMGVNPGTSQMDSSFDQSFQQGDSFTSAGDLSYTKTGEMHIQVKKACELCNRVISAKNMARHLLTHSGKKSFVCECGKAFNQKANLDRHMVRHSEGIRTYCGLTKKSYVSAIPGKGSESYGGPGSQAAVATSDLGDEFDVLACVPKSGSQCPICLKVLTSRKNIYAHLRTHSSSKNFQCNLCSSRFRRKHHLEGHMMSIHGNL